MTEPRYFNLEPTLPSPQPANRLLTPYEIQRLSGGIKGVAILVRQTRLAVRLSRSAFELQARGKGFARTETTGDLARRKLLELQAQYPLADAWLANRNGERDDRIIIVPSQAKWERRMVEKYPETVSCE